MRGPRMATSATDPPLVTPRRSQYTHNDYYQIPKLSDAQISFTFSLLSFIALTVLYESRLFSYFTYVIVGGAKASLISATLFGLILVSLYRVMVQTWAWAGNDEFGATTQPDQKQSDAFTPKLARDSIELIRRLTQTRYRSARGEQRITTVGEVFERRKQDSPSAAAAERRAKNAKQFGRVGFGNDRRGDVTDMSMDKTFQDAMDKSWASLDPKGPEILNQFQEQSKPQKAPEPPQYPSYPTAPMQPQGLFGNVQSAGAYQQAPGMGPLGQTQTTQPTQAQFPSYGCTGFGTSYPRQPTVSQPQPTTSTAPFQSTSGYVPARGPFESRTFGAQPPYQPPQQTTFPLSQQPQNVQPIQRTTAFEATQAPSSLNRRMTFFDKRQPDYSVRRAPQSPRYQTSARRAMDKQARTVRTPIAKKTRDVGVGSSYAPSPLYNESVFDQEKPSLMLTPTEDRPPLFPHITRPAGPLPHPYQPATRDGPRRKPPGPGFGGSGFKGVDRNDAGVGKSIVDGIECVEPFQFLNQLGIVAFMDGFASNMETWISRHLLDGVTRTIQQVDDAFYDYGMEFLATTKYELPLDSNADVTSISVRSHALNAERSTRATTSTGFYSGTGTGLLGGSRLGVAAGAKQVVMLAPQPLRLHQSQKVLDKSLTKATSTTSTTTTGGFGGTSLFPRQAPKPDAAGTEALPKDLPELVERFGHNDIVQERIKLERYLTVPGFPRARLYVRSRVLELGITQLGGYRPNGGGDWCVGESHIKNAWDRNIHPTDAQILIHLWNTFMDLAMPDQVAAPPATSAANPFGTTLGLMKGQTTLLGTGTGTGSLFGSSFGGATSSATSTAGTRPSVVGNVDWAVLDSRPFSSKYYSRMGSRLGTDTRSPSIRHLRSEPAHHYCIYMGGQFWDLHGGRQNVFEVLAMFVFVIYHLQGGYLEAVDMKAKWLKLHGIFDLS